MGARHSRAGERLPGARPQLAVLGDQRPVEVEREGGAAPRELRREDDRYGAVPPVESTTKAATSAICCVVSFFEKDGIDAPPFVTCAVTAR
jgi:hypothetical protein